MIGNGLLAKDCDSKWAGTITILILVTSIIWSVK